MYQNKTFKNIKDQNKNFKTKPINIKKILKNNEPKMIIPYKLTSKIFNQTITQSYKLQSRTKKGELKISLISCLHIWYKYWIHFSNVIK